MSGVAARPSPAYLFTFAMASVSLPCLGIGLGGLLLLRAGRDPLDAVNGMGVVGFVAAILLNFLMRLIFWVRSPDFLRAFVRTGIALVFGLSVCASLYAIAVDVTASTKTAPWISWFIAAAAVFNVASIVWLLRFRSS